MHAHKLNAYLRLLTANHVSEREVSRCQLPLTITIVNQAVVKSSSFEASALRLSDSRGGCVAATRRVIILHSADWVKQRVSWTINHRDGI